MAEALRVLIADEDPDSRVNTRKALQRAELGLAGETGFGTGAVSLALETRPDIILVAVEEPVARALETAEALANALPDTPTIIYSSNSDAEAVRRAMVFGARDYLMKPVQAERVRGAILTALQQEERRQMRRAGQMLGDGGRGTVIAVTGAKGGVGKSVISANLAVALRRETGKSVAIIDADTEFGDVATMLDATPAMTASDLLRRHDVDRHTIQQFMTHHETGVEILAAPADDDDWNSCSPEQLTQIIGTIAGLYEFVVIDTSGAFDDFVRVCIESSALSFIVTSGEVSSVRNTATAMRRVERWGIDGDRVRLILNRGAEARGVKVADIESAVGRVVFWEIGHDQAVSTSVQVGRPVVMEDRRRGAGPRLVELARRIAGTTVSLTTPPTALPLWKRMIPNRGESNEPASEQPRESSASSENIGG